MRFGGAWIASPWTAWAVSIQASLKVGCAWMVWPSSRTVSSAWPWPAQVLGTTGGRAHLLRRTLATHLVQQGASLKAVADLLGHASLRTAQVYAKVNLPMLRAVAQPWPGEVDR